MKEFDTITEFKEWCKTNNYADDHVADLRTRLHTEVELEPIEFVLGSMKRMLNAILTRTEAERYEVYLTGHNQFRNEIYPLYKANRKDSPKPEYLPDLRDYLMRQWQATMCEYIEADDALAIAQTNYGDNSIICTIDKDLLMVPGHHYNFVKGELSYVTPDEGMRHFYAQLLAGDAVDNIPGIKGVGLIKANKMLPDSTDEMELWSFASEKLAEEGFLPEEIIVNARLLWMMRSHEDKWSPPNDR
jgi:5'-3' exonuclease